ncbi:MAG: hypothetical protein KDG55_17720 [Rhodocyclaceae bacterium]|nr:hypothetical protein [Rhodocyclaceae bacterium]
MAGFEPYSRDAREIEREITIRGLALGIDWNDAGVVRALAHELVSGGADQVQALARDPDPRRRAKGELFAFAILMQRTMAESAAQGIHTHGGEVWKALGRAIYEASGQAPRTGE